MESLQYIQPSAFLAPYVKHYWILETDCGSGHTQRVIPSGSIQLTFYRLGNVRPREQGSDLGGAGVICGQHAEFLDLTVEEQLKIISVVFYPHGAGAFFPVPASEFTGTLQVIKSLEDKGLEELEARIMEAADDAGCIRLIENFLLKRMKPPQERTYGQVASAVDTVGRHCTEEISVADLAGSVCLGTRQFNRIFTEHVGVSPKGFIRMVRFQKALYILQHFPRMPFTDLALECGYYDQSHLIREFKIFSGYTPGEYLAVCAPFSDYFS